MGCTSCSNSSNSSPRGCKNNGTCGTDSCNKLTVFDWLSNMKLPNGENPFDIVEVRFKNSRKEFYRVSDDLNIKSGDIVITDAENGHDVGIVSLSGELVRIQMDKKKINLENDKIFSIRRLAEEKDIKTWKDSKDREDKVQKETREIAISLKLEMKISDVEFQGDGSKAVFYYTAENRVDFRQLIKNIAQAFKIKVEMRQIGLRQEASRLGGLGSCGRELCCSTWLTDFRSVSTSAARYQQLSLNPQKLAGQCGKLKCCLNYELDSYRNALKKFPKTEIKLVTEKGKGIFQKMDIFKGCLWYSYEGEWSKMHVLTSENAIEIIEKNKNNQKVNSLEEFAINQLFEKKNNSFGKDINQDEINRFQINKNNKSNTKKKYKGKKKH